MKNVFTSIVCSFLVTACVTAKPQVANSYVVLPYQSSPMLDAKYERALALKNLGNPDGTNLLLEAAREGQQDALYAYAVEDYYRSGEPRFRAGKMDSSWGDVTPNWAVEALALQGDRRAIIFYWKGMTHEFFDKDIRAGIAALEYLVGQGDPEATHLLFNYYMSYDHANRLDVIAPKRDLSSQCRMRDCEVREPDFIKAEHYARMYSELVTSSKCAKPGISFTNYYKQSITFANTYAQRGNYISAAKWYDDAQARMSDKACNELVGRLDVNNAQRYLRFAEEQSRRIKSQAYSS